MSHDEEPSFADFGAEYWEDRYRSGAGSSKYQPSPALVTEAAGLPPGRALDAGCGVGGDALWLAARGWRVTAVDISPTALDRGRHAADVAGRVIRDRIDWVHGDLTRWEPNAPGYDLVTSQYVHVPGAPETLFRRLASWVAPGGALLVVGHDAGHEHEHPNVHPASAQVSTEQIVSCLPEEEWEVRVAGSRAHTRRRPDGHGAVTLNDVVVHARRRRATPPAATTAATAHQAATRRTGCPSCQPSTSAG